MITEMRLNALSLLFYPHTDCVDYEAKLRCCRIQGHYYVLPLLLVHGKQSVKIGVAINDLGYHGDVYSIFC